MGNKKISELNLLTTPQLSTIVPVVESGETQKMAIGSILNSGLPISASSISGSTIHSEDYYINGNKLFNYGSFSDSTIQSASINTATSIRLNTIDVPGRGVSVTSGSRITFDHNGVYNVQFSAQLDRTGGTGTVVTSIWLAYTGSNVADSGGDVVMTGNTNTAAVIASWNYLIPVKAHDWVEFKWSTPDNDIVLFATGSRTNPVRPKVPSMIVTVTQVA